MLDIVEPRHVAALLSPFERGDSEDPGFADSFAQGAPFAPRISLQAPEMQAEFEMVRQRLLAEPV